MSPTVRQRPSPPRADATGVRARTPAAVVYAVALLVAAIALVAGLAMAGSGWPTPAVVLLLAVPLAWCMNRYVLFPNEVGVTADAAVIVAAMLVCRVEAPWLGPLLVALLVGVLDVRHWEERAFARMAYNSGSTALVTATSLLAFTATVDRFGTSAPALLGAAVAAAVPYVVAESCFGVVLVALLGERPGAALRHQLPLNSVALPLAVLGAEAALAADAWGLWATPLLLLPAPFVPELLLVVVPRRVPAATRWLVLAAALLALSVVAGGVLHGVAGDVAGVVAGGCAFLALALADHVGSARRAPPPTLAAVAAVVAGALVPFTVGGAGASTGAVAVATVVGALVLLACEPRRTAALVWVLPVVVVAATAGRVWAVTGPLGALPAVAAVVVPVVLAVGHGPAPWRSRLLARVPGRPVGAAVLVLVVLAVGAVALAVAATDPTRRVAALVGVLAVEALVLAGAWAVRLWRFVPRRRAIDVVVLAVVAVAALAVALPLAEVGSVLAVPVAGAGALLAASRVRLAPRRDARPPVRTARDRPS